MYMQCQQRPEEGAVSLDLEIQLEQLCGCWEPNPGPVPLTTGYPAWPLGFHLRIRVLKPCHVKQF